MGRKIKPEDYTTTGNYVQAQRDYIEGAISKAMQALDDFSSVRYAWSITGGEFVKISDTIGNVMFLDVTGMTRAEILKDVAKCILLDDMELGGLVPESLVKDINLKREIARLFN